MISIIIPAYNEELRIAKTLQEYANYSKIHNLSWQFLVVLNGCTDNTQWVVQQHARLYPAILYITIKEAGKGRAIKEGFLESLKYKNSAIGFVDADGAILPEDFHSLCEKLNEYCVVIGSRYMPEHNVKRPLYKMIGRKIIYHPLLYFLFGFSFYDMQCGAKIFKREVIENIAAQLTATNWSIDPELLYLAKKYHYSILEVPIFWKDQSESKFTVCGGINMIFDLFRLYYIHK